MTLEEMKYKSKPTKGCYKCKYGDAIPVAYRAVRKHVYRCKNVNYFVHKYGTCVYYEPRQEE